MISFAVWPQRAMQRNGKRRTGLTERITYEVGFRWRKSYSGGNFRWESRGNVRHPDRGIHGLRGQTWKTTGRRWNGWGFRLRAETSDYSRASCLSSIGEYPQARPCVTPASAAVPAEPHPARRSQTAPTLPPQTAAPVPA